MKCPKCPDQEMTASTHEGIEVDRCPSCKGVWLDKGEASRILKQDLGFSIDTGEHVDIGKHQNHKPAHCPRCDRPMEALTGKDKVTFDYCRTCKSTFLDAGELAALQTLRRFR